MHTYTHEGSIHRTMSERSTSELRPAPCLLSNSPSTIFVLFCVNGLCRHAEHLFIDTNYLLGRKC